MARAADVQCKSTGIKYRLAFSGLSRAHDYVLPYLPLKRTSRNDANEFDSPVSDFSRLSKIQSWDAFARTLQCNLSPGFAFIVVLLLAIITIV